MIKKLIILLTCILSMSSIGQENSVRIEDGFSLYQYKGFVEEVYDGDTVTLRISLGFNIQFKEKIRLYGINAPEVRGSERPKGLLSRDYLRSLILNKTVYIKTIKDKRGKYGRILGDIYYEIDGKFYNVNDLLVLKGLAERKNY